jgi:hypothetical protein
MGARRLIGALAIVSFCGALIEAVSAFILADDAR